MSADGTVAACVAQDAERTVAAAVGVAGTAKRDTRADAGAQANESCLVSIIHDAKVIGLEVRFLFARKPAKALMADPALSVI
jgi:hypothetical protein